MVAGTIVTQQVSFLTSGPMLQVQTPNQFSGMLPELSSPLINGKGPRSFDFTPTEMSDGPPDDYELIATFEGSYPAELYSWPYSPPPQWFLRWRLSRGSIWTHLREEDGPTLASSVVEALGIAEDERGLPFLLPDPPVRSAVSARPGFQEFVTFFSREWPDARLTLQRPGYLPIGETRSLPEGVRDFTLVRRGLANGIDVLVRTFEKDAISMAENVEVLTG